MQMLILDEQAESTVCQGQVPGRPEILWLLRTRRESALTRQRLLRQLKARAPHPLE